MTTLPLQQAREHLVGAHLPVGTIGEVTEEEYLALHEHRTALLNLLPALVAEAERWQAMAIEGQAWRLFYIQYDDSEYPDANTSWRRLDEKEKKKYRDLATSELAAESSSWRKIGPEERQIIEDSISAIDFFPCLEEEDKEYHEYSKRILRNLLEGIP